MLVLMVACDPGMTIRQTKSLPKGRRAAMQAVALHVKTSHPLIGQTWYAPEVKVTNPFDSPITITSVEFVTRRETYANKTARPGAYPLVIQPGSTEILHFGFRLNDDVKKTFLKQSAELRLRYRTGNKEEIAHTNIIGGRLDTSTL
jgi:hypothetical protein